jgi:hypothetical protein
LNNGKNDMSEKDETNFYTLQQTLQGLLNLYKKNKK